jgi:hypothetical protein
MNNAHDIGLSGLRGDVAVFYDWPASGVAELRERYRRFACAKCKTLDRGKALGAAGVDPAFAERVSGLKLDAFATNDGQDLMSRPVFDALDRAFRGVLVAKAVPGTRYVIVLPKRPAELAPGAPKPAANSMFRVTAPLCRLCRRFPESVYRPQYIALPAGKHLMGVVLQNGSWHVGSTAWVGDDAVRDFLAKKRWKGLKVTRGFYGKKSPFHEAAKRRKAAQTPENNAWLKLLKDSGQR